MLTCILKPCPSNSHLSPTFARMSSQRHGEEQSKDEERLAKLGYKQEFKRDFSPLELFGLSFGLIGKEIRFSLHITDMNIPQASSHLSRLFILYLL